MEVQAGLDLHSTNTYVAMIDQENKALYKQRHRNEATAILSALDSFKKNIRRYPVGGRPYMHIVASMIATIRSLSFDIEYPPSDRLPGRLRKVTGVAARAGTAYCRLLDTVYMGQSN
jgi:hypothetical protein